MLAPRAALQQQQRLNLLGTAGPDAPVLQTGCCLPYKVHEGAYLSTTDTKNDVRTTTLKGCRDTQAQGMHASSQRMTGGAKSARIPVAARSTKTLATETPVTSAASARGRVSWKQSRGPSTKQVNRHVPWQSARWPRAKATLRRPSAARLLTPCAKRTPSSRKGWRPPCNARRRSARRRRARSKAVQVHGGKPRSTAGHAAGARCLAHRRRRRTS